MTAKAKLSKRVKPLGEAATPSKKAKKEEKTDESTKTQKKVEEPAKLEKKIEVKAEPVDTPKKKEKKKKENRQHDKVVTEAPAKKEKKSEEVEMKTPVEKEPSEQKKKQSRNQKKKNKKAQSAVQVETKEKEENAYVPGALSALFGTGGDVDAAGGDVDTTKKPDIFDKYSDGDSGYVEVPTVIEKVEGKKVGTATDENSRKKQRENRKKNPDDRELVDERKRTVFVGNLPVHYTIKELKALFSKCGQIDSVRLRGTVGNKETISKKVAFLSGKLNENIASIIGYVKFESPETVEKAVTTMNGTLVEGHRIHVDGCVGIKNYDRKVSVFVGNLPFEIRDDELFEWAEECVGPVDFVRVVRDRNTGYGRGVGFITFKDHLSIDKALSLANPVIGGKEVRLQKVLKKNEKKDQRKNDAKRKELRKQKKLDKKAGIRGDRNYGKIPQQKQQRGGAHGAAAAASDLPHNPLLPRPTTKPVRPSRKVQKEIMKRKKMAGPKSLMK